MGIFNNKDKDGNRYIDLPIIAGIDSITKNTPIRITLLEDELVIKQRFFKKETVHLKYSKITNVGIVNEKDIQEKDKSVLGRAVAGGLVLGPLGAVIGGVSGIGKKEKKKTKIYYIINYKSSDDGEIKALSFSLSGAMNIGKFTEELKVRAKIKKQINL